MGYILHIAGCNLHEFWVDRSSNLDILIKVVKPINLERKYVVVRLQKDP